MKKLAAPKARDPCTIQSHSVQKGRVVPHTTPLALSKVTLFPKPKRLPEKAREGK